MGKHIHNIWHCTATPEGMDIDKNKVLQWHMGPKLQENGTYKYKGKTYRRLADLPDEKIGGVHVSRLKGNGWDRPGYRKLVLLDGSVQEMWPVNEDDYIESHEMTWGALGVNANAMHYCYVGGLSNELVYDKSRGKKVYPAKDTRTKEQLVTMIQITLDQVKLNPKTKWSGHNQHNRKACPSFDVIDFCREIGVPDINIYLRRL